MKQILFSLGLIGILAAGLLRASAQGTAFTYQGRLNVNGLAASGVYDFRFRLAADPLANAYIGTPSFTNGVSVSAGLFTTLVDFGSDVFGGSNYWLEVDVRTNGAGSYTALAPLQFMTATPYAVFAGTASNFSGSVAVSQLSGTLTPAQLPTNVDSLTLDGQPAGAFWQLAGNGVSPGQFIGSTNNQPVTIEVDNQRLMQFTIATNSLNGQAPNVVAGSPLNYVSNNVIGATISGGGSTNAFIYHYSGNGYAGYAPNIGPSNAVYADYGTVVGGFGNKVNGVAGTAGGVGSKADGPSSTAFGLSATASGEDSVALGYLSTASGFAALSAGFNITASGFASTALGFGSQAIHDHSFVWSDNSAGQFSSTTSNQFSVHADNGIRLSGNVQLDGGYRNLSLSGGNALGYLYGSFPKYADGVHLGYNYYADANGNNHVFNTGGATSRITAGYGFIDLAVGAVNAEPSTVALHATSSGVSVFGTFNNNSDRNAKQNFSEVKRAEILDEVLRLPITEWNYKTDPATRHLGPMAQDFHALFKIGTDEKHIAPIDEGGVALAAIQGLDKKFEDRNDALDNRTRELETENAELKKSVDELKQLVATLSQRVNDRNP